MTPEPNPFEPPAAATPPTRSASRRGLVTLALVGLASAFALCVGASDLLVGIPVRRFYFPKQVRPYEVPLACTLLMGGLTGLVGSGRASSKRWREARRPKS